MNHSRESDWISIESGSGFYETPDEENGVPWSADGLCVRLSNPKFRYGLHAVENLLLVSSPRVRRGTPYTLHCGYFIRRGAQVRRRDIVAVTRAASRLWRHPLFVYPGLHTAMPQLPWRAASPSPSAFDDAGSTAGFSAAQTSRCGSIATNR